MTFLLAIFGIVLYAAAIAVALPTTMFALECVLAVFARPSRPDGPDGNHALPGNRTSADPSPGTGTARMRMRMRMRMPRDWPARVAARSAWREQRQVRDGEARMRGRPPESDGPPRFVIVVPAHDEAAVIGATLARLTPTLGELGSHGQVLVVADNCTDDTARIAREHGATVLERRDAANRGKGFALAFAARHLASDPPDVLVFVDADCLVAPGAIRALVEASFETGRPVQADYLIESRDPSATPQTAISAFAFLVRNRVRPLGLAHVGGPCGLFGTGMAMPYALFASLPDAEGHLVEDMWLGVECALRGRAPLFVPEARVTSDAPALTEAGRTQRTRWEHGHLAVIRQHVPRLLFSGKTDAILLGIDLAIPPLALLALAHVVLLVVALALAVVGGNYHPFVLALSSLVWFTGAVALAWASFGRTVVPARTLLSIPGYVLWKLPIYLGYVRKRETSWVKTSRAEPTREP